MLEKRMIQEDELRSEFEDYLLSWEPTEKWLIAFQKRLGVLLPAF